MSGARPVGALVMAHGTPRRPEELEAFYTRIRRGRPPTSAQLAELRGRYEAIGGLSPLTERTQAQVAGLTRVLEERAPGRFAVAFGAKHAEPFIEEAAADLVTRGVAGVVGLVLTPQESAMGSGEYLERARHALADVAPFAPVAAWYDRPVLARLFGQRLAELLARSPVADEDPGSVQVLFTAHSLPERIRLAGDPYPDEVAATAGAVASTCGLDERGVSWQVAWQSPGRTGEPWMGPDLLSVLRQLGSEGRVSQVVVVPVGFVSDHLEILYDLDVEAAGVARDLGLGFARTASLNDDLEFVGLLADLVLDAGTALRPLDSRELTR